MKKKHYRTLDEIELEYLKTHPEEVDSYLESVLAAYEEDGDEGAFLSSLKIIAMAKNVSMAELAKKTGLNRENLYRALSKKGNPRFSTISKIFHTLGYTLKLEPMMGLHHS